MTASRAKQAPARRPGKRVWRKPPADLVERFNAALPVHPEAKPRKMFGYPACFVNGYFFVGLHNENVIVRLPGELKDRRPELAGAARFDPMGTGKGLKDWWLIPESIAENGQRLTAFFAATFSDVRALPPKAPKSRASSRKPQANP
ncbi:MAG TPA: TfoX/Sxy family protein [Anaerolineales bacterium]|nr:TfoX/Sxy family protein [Anaerolineales bacterium]